MDDVITNVLMAGSLLSVLLDAELEVIERGVIGAIASISYIDIALSEYFVAHLKQHQSGEQCAE